MIDFIKMIILDVLTFRHNPNILIVTCKYFNGYGFFTF
jgi:hypothetical protein